MGLHEILFVVHPDRKRAQWKECWVLLGAEKKEFLSYSFFCFSLFPGETSGAKVFLPGRSLWHRKGAGCFGLGSGSESRRQCGTQACIV